MRFKSNGSSLIIWLIVLVALVAAGIYGYKFWQSHNGPEYEYET